MNRFIHGCPGGERLFSLMCQEMYILHLTAPLFLIIFIGYTLKKCGVVDEAFGSQLNRYVYYVALPLMLFSKISSVTMDFSFSLVAGYLAAMVTVAVISLWLSRFFRGKERGALVQGSFRSNLTYLGLPIVLYALGDEALGYAAIIMAVMIIFHNVITIAVFRHIGSQGMSGGWVRGIGSTLMDPLIISIVLGMLFSFGKIPIPLVFANTIELIARMSLPSILLIIGISLSFTDIRKYVLKDAVTAGLKLVLMPLVAYGIMDLLFHAPPLITMVTVLLAAMPTAVVSVTFVKEFSGDYRFAASIVSFNTVLSMLTIPIVLHILGTGLLSP